MVNIFASVCFAALLYLCCLLLCVAVKKLIAKLPRRPAESKSEKPTESAVYYVTTPPKKAKKRPKSHTIPLKGAMLPSGTKVIASDKALTEIKRTAKPKLSQTAKKPTKATAAKRSGKGGYSTLSPSPQRRSK